jgi:hypothetical protein
MDTATRLSLEPLVALAKRSFGRPDRDIHSLAWRAFALSLFEYRRGDFSSAIYWGERSLGYADSAASRIAMSHLVLAMANCRLHQMDAAQTELALGRKPVEQKLPKGLEGGLSQGDSTSGFWHDWLHAYLLLQEASACAEASGP